MGGVVLLGVGAAVWLVGYWLPTRFDITAGRSQPGELVSRWLGMALMVAGVVVWIAELT